MATSLEQRDLPFMHAALAASGIGTWDYDICQDKCFCDSIAALLFGLSDKDGSNGVPIARLVETLHPDDRPNAVSRRLAMMARGGLLVNEYRTIPSPGVVRWLLIRGRYETDAGGEPVRGRGIVIDMTESKQNGFAEGEAYFTMTDQSETETDLDRVAGLALATRQAIDGLGDSAPRLRSAIDALLLEIGRELSAAVNEAWTLRK